MKKLTILAITAFMVSFSSCSEDLLDQTAVNSITYDGNQTIESESQMQYVLNGMYSELGSADALGADIIMFGELISDNAFISNKNDGRFKITNAITWTASDTNTDFNQFNKLYDAVGMANIIINTEIEQTKAVKSMVAQAYAARGLAFYYLASFYAANPTSGINQEYGIPIHTGDYDPNAYYPRATVSETYAQIISDLEKGISEFNEVTDNKGYINANAARIALAKAYLTRGGSGDYEKAIQYADEALVASSNLLTKDQIQSYFAGTTSAEVKDQPETAFEINMSITSNPGVNRSLGSFYDPNGRKGYFMFREGLANLVNENDARKVLFTQENAATNDDPMGYYLMKYMQVIDDNSHTGNVRVIRLTEAKFIKWEAMAKLGQDATVLAELNEFAAERGGSEYTGDALTAVLAEKRIEFAGEGLRFFDLKRNNLGFDKVTNIRGNANPVTADSKLFVLPIPSSSLNLNKLITQYPGWYN
ncbi:RagB/SusD family nutrient uptake outer membrane protein [Faecalibacter rhinopitheci]|uniref:RagB/SusD family nutrient uptake outer membrane protein n=1 Tax=Faecalibacter rhinopitheci TaxID=2779678 RepID=A0A8J7G429_9FLAO|nr:RagB/SusD family nutrient uptake outer membrane protein [Faecalibacter rhinopitheci]MBF0596282.1 RagB/SusD family nutrient uptake outer membrane protein [Faecalibacter rhinopitheci]